MRIANQTIGLANKMPPKNGRGVLGAMKLITIKMAKSTATSKLIAARTILGTGHTLVTGSGVTDGDSNGFSIAEAVQLGRFLQTHWIQSETFRMNIPLLLE